MSLIDGLVADPVLFDLILSSQSQTHCKLTHPEPLVVDIGTVVVLIYLVLSSRGKKYNGFTHRGSWTAKVIVLFDLVLSS